MADVREVLADVANKSWAEMKYDIQRDYYSTYGIYMPINKLEATLGFDVVGDGDDPEEASMEAINDQEDVEALLDDLLEQLDNADEEDFDKEDFDEEDSRGQSVEVGFEVSDTYIEDMVYISLMYNLGKAKAKERDGFNQVGEAGPRMNAILKQIKDYKKEFQRGLMMLYNRLGDGKVTDEQKKAWLEYGVLPFENNLDVMVNAPDEWEKLVEITKHKLEGYYPRNK